MVFSTLARTQSLLRPSFITTNGLSQMGPYQDMPENTAAGTLYNPPDTETCCGISYDGSK
eukprot:CAMPEP_0175969526 /NCGR_PEP_ID=MMETSP0108-20121206/40528_1 /TAXON_ID=195067 ORGANISM="Goniomonas pacifica, Strain CCMP1869" /NCGR_SAMPLE_ID=MMETSP0108 /ASSEMBLY_ACC=CAM_ASM_000204 /LENGTH=59 /DNA_ID=CAMNT_0017298353 /DNA_START=14 /DNA_END=193 /DNA_ORIENTATION=+